MKKLVYIFLIFLTYNAKSQTVLSDIALMDYQRIAQLINQDSLPARSFVIRSSSQLWNEQIPDSSKNKKWPQFNLVQFGYTLQNNSQLPIGHNDGSMYPSVGLQQRITLGANLQWKGFTLHLQPELVTAANADPVSFKSDPADGNYWAKYYLYTVNKIDNFSRIGTEPIQQFLLGQSSLLYNTNNISLGISSENLWWGPGIRNSLVLTNNAPGFLHATIKSNKPISTKWGNIEFQAILGQLKNVETEAPDNALMRTIWADGIAKKPPVERNMIGYIFNWNPKWTPNLHIGFTGSNYFYNGFVEEKSSILVLDAENKSGAASLGAVFFRYAMPKEHAEVYLEYGRANKLANPFNIWSDTIPTGYTAGFRKIFKKSNKAGGILLGIEITQLQLPDARLIFNRDAVFGIPRTNSWYTHPFISQGYTNEGQVMGASIGPGSNSETLNLSWVKGLKRIGINVERVTYNNDFVLYNYFTGNVGVGTTNKYWVDLNIGFQVQWGLQTISIIRICQLHKSLKLSMGEVGWRFCWCIRTIR